MHREQLPDSTGYARTVGTPLYMYCMFIKQIFKYDKPDSHSSGPYIRGVAKRVKAFVLA